MKVVERRICIRGVAWRGGACTERLVGCDYSHVASARCLPSFAGMRKSAALPAKKPYPVLNDCNILCDRCVPSSVW